MGGPSVNDWGESMVARIIKAIIVLFGILLVIYPCAQYAREATKVATMLRSGTFRSEITLAGNDLARSDPGSGDPDGNHPDSNGPAGARSALIFVRVDSLDFASPPIPSDGDTLLAITDSSGVSEDPLTVFERPHAVGDSLRLIFRAAAQAQQDTSTVVARRHEFAAVLSVFGLQVLRVLVHLGYLVVGFWAFLRRPDSAGVRALTLFCLAMVALMTVGVQVLPASYAGFDIPGQRSLGIFLTGFLLFFGSFWLNLAVLFPRPIGFLRRRPWVAYGLIYVLPVAVLLGQLLDLRLPPFLPALAVALVIGAGFTVLATRRSRTTDPLERRQLALVSFGTGLGLGALLLVVLINFVPGLGPRLGRLFMVGAVIFAFLCMLISPISFLYAFGRYRLLEVEGRIRRGTRFAAVTVILLAAFVGVLFGVSELLLKVLRVESRTPTVAVAMVSALGFFPVLRRTHRLVEDRFYPERRRLRALLNDLLTATSAMPDRAALWTHLQDRLQTGLGVSRVIPLVFDDEARAFVNPAGRMAPLDAQGVLVRELVVTGRPHMVDELRAAERIEIPGDLDRWLTTEKVSLLLPMMVHGRLRGILALAFDQEFENLAAEELSLLASVASQVGLQSENLRLLEENIEKRHLAEQLATARRVQQRFLPQELPVTPGLDVVATCVSSLEVAGDYYDVIPLGKGRTLLAIGDVSGKGAGAAMIMANVQASLRALSGFKVELSQAVTQLNDVIYGNTETGQFITFFAAIYDPAGGTLTYVNAGHNPPRIVRSGGEVISLDAGGPILGVLPNLRYEQVQVRVRPGDLFLSFTDGVTEARSPDDLEFGEDHLVWLVREHGTEPLERIPETIQQAVEAHTGSTSFADDLTLLIARVRDLS